MMQQACNRRRRDQLLISCSPAQLRETMTLESHRMYRNALQESFVVEIPLLCVDGAGINTSVPAGTSTTTSSLGCTLLLCMCRVTADGNNYNLCCVWCVLLSASLAYSLGGPTSPLWRLPGVRALLADPRCRSLAVELGKFGSMTQCYSQAVAPDPPRDFEPGSGSKFSGFRGRARTEPNRTTGHTPRPSRTS